MHNKIYMMTMTISNVNGETLRKQPRTVTDEVCATKTSESAQHPQ